MILLPFRAKHLAELHDLGGQEWVGDYLHRIDPLTYEAAGPAFSGVIDGAIVGSAGLMVFHDHRAMAWAILSRVAPCHFLAIHREVARFLDQQTYRRIEAFIDPTFSAAIRWVLMLGFTLESEEKPWFFPDGRAASEYVRIR